MVANRSIADNQADACSFIPLHSRLRLKGANSAQPWLCRRIICKCWRGSGPEKHVPEVTGGRRTCPQGDKMLIMRSEATVASTSGCCWVRSGQK